MLNVFDWSGSAAGGGTDQLFFGTNAAGLTANQLAWSNSSTRSDPAPASQVRASCNRRTRRDPGADSHGFIARRTGGFLQAPASQVGLKGIKLCFSLQLMADDSYQKSLSPNVQENQLVITTVAPNTDRPRGMRR
jgi:hypothetical protein